MIGGAFIGEVRLIGQGLMDAEAGFIRENTGQGPLCLRRLDRAMPGRQQIGRSEMHPPVSAVSRGRDHGRIGGPHRRGRTGAAQQMRRLARDALDDLRITAGKPQGLEQGQIRPLMRRHHALQQADIGQGLHLRDAFEHGFARRGCQPLAACTRQIALGQTTIIMGRPDQPVEIGFNGSHGTGLSQLQSIPLMAMYSGSGAAWVATGKAQ